MAFPFLSEKIGEITPLCILKHQESISKMKTIKKENHSRPEFFVSFKNKLLVSYKNPINKEILHQAIGKIYRTKIELRFSVCCSINKIKYYKVPLN